MSPAPDLNALVAKLEKENRNLLTRVEKLEKQRGSAFPAFLANVVLLVAAGILAGYLGLYPPGVDNWPLTAKRVAAEEFVLRKGGVVHARMVVENDKVHVIDAGGNSLYSKP